MESDDENLVCCGSPVRPLEDDEIPKKRPISTEDQIVTDEKGRRRFHGAFTGGFSAGYFNSVGTKEGWAPSTFISSRSNRFSQKDQRPEDFMDAEDLGEFGIAHRTIHTTSKFNQQEKPSRKRQLPSQEGPIPGEPPLKDLIIPIKETIGVILLRKLGWRPGQGIGPRVKKKKQRFKGKNSSSLPDEIHSEDLYDEYAEKFDFAPKDISIAKFKPKDNVHGLGYSGLDQKTSVLGNLMSRQQSSVYFVEGKKVQISGQAFGVGVYEDDDEDIYSQEDMSGYHFALEDLPSKSHTSSSSNFSSTGIGVSNQPVPGFLPSSNKVFKIFDKQYFPPPILPKNYQPFHLVKATPLSSDIPTGLNRHSLNSASRSAILEEKQPDSVLNLLSSEDKAKLEKAKLSLTTQKDSFQSKSLDQNNTNSTKSPFSFENFKPFAKNEVKQQKFEEYLKLFLSSDKSDSEHFVKHLPFMLTEWEKKEFQRTALLYKPLAGGIATRFVSAKNTEIVEELEMPKKLQVDKSDQQKAADMKMFGKLTREKVTWYPNKLLCKRFNVPNPHSDSASGRSANAKDEKVSIFNMFTQNTEAKSILSFQSDSKTPPEDLPAKNLKLESPEKDEEVQIVQENAPEEEEKPTMDLFKAIFESSDDSDDDSDEQTTKPASDKAVKEKSSDKNPVFSSALSHNTSIASHSIRTSETSPTLKHSSDQSSVKPIASHLHNEAPIEATGLFANLDLDKLKAGFKSNSSKRQTESVTDSSSSNVHLVSAPSTSTDMFYGPKLPPVSPSITGQNISAEISAKSQFEGSKKKHKEKKHKKHKHKHKSKKSRSRHYSDETLLSRLRQLNSDASHKKKGH